ncbi:hypothetical protein WR25_11412 [Diploscapter pachys]|uniref:Chromatin target of PRMT1 protein C-terminal domain-containing protein n=1 Tax=Diploscapter pachys TaxID=2018661 RepID=A0A2A2JS38_9BILA|nr:hypothetical protein WR25_11412 [Diploscapter pachys]
MTTTKVTEVGVPAKVVIVGTSKMSLHQRFSKLPKSTIVPKVRRIISKTAIYKPPRRSNPPTYYDEDAEMDEEPIGEELNDFEDEEEEEEFYDNRVSMRNGGQRRRFNVQQQQQQLSLADRLTKNPGYHRGRRGGGYANRGGEMRVYRSQNRFEHDEYANFHNSNRRYGNNRNSGGFNRGGFGYHRGRSFPPRYPPGGGFNRNNRFEGGKYGNKNKKTTEELDKELDQYMRRPSGSGRHQPIEF